MAALGLGLRRLSPGSKQNDLQQPLHPVLQSLAGNNAGKQLAEPAGLIQAPPSPSHFGGGPLISENMDLIHLLISSRSGISSALLCVPLQDHNLRE